MRIQIASGWIALGMMLMPATFAADAEPAAEAELMAALRQRSLQTADTNDAPENILAVYDTDPANGTLDPAELAVYRRDRNAEFRAMLARFDANVDGRLGADERSVAADIAEQARLARTQSYDKDRDGAINDAERLAALRERVKQTLQRIEPRPAKGAKPMALDPVFEKALAIRFDRDGDNVVSATEMADVEAAKAACRALLQEQAARDAALWIALFDANRDRALDDAEQEKVVEFLDLRFLSHQRTGHLSIDEQMLMLEAAAPAKSEPVKR